MCNSCNCIHTHIVHIYIQNMQLTNPANCAKLWYICNSPFCGYYLLVFALVLILLLLLFSCVTAAAAVAFGCGIY